MPGLIDTSAYFKFFKKLLESGGGKVEEKQVPGSRGFYKELLFEKLLEHLLPKIEAHTGHELYKTYSYARQYEIGHELKPHTDRSACEITATLALGFEGDIWPIWGEDRTKAHHSFLLKAGDALIFRGMELKHWREENSFGSCSQVFLHYVDRNGPCACYKDDAIEDELKARRQQNYRGQSRSSSIDTLIQLARGQRDDLYAFNPTLVWNNDAKAHALWQWGCGINPAHRHIIQPIDASSTR